MTNLKKLLIFCISLLFSGQLCAQNIGLNSAFGTVKTFTPASPEVAKFQRYGDLEVNYNTGIPSIAVPLGSIKLKDFEWPISLTYHAGGNKVNEFASNTGLGWVLQASGYYSSKIMGNASGITPVFGLNLMHNGINQPDGCNGANIYANPNDIAMAESVVASGGFAQPSIDYINTALINAKVVEGVTVPASDIRISPSGGMYHVLDEKGNKYTFGLMGSSSTTNSCSTGMGISNLSYALTKIETYKGEIITFSYEMVTYSYALPPSEIRQRFNGTQSSRCYAEVPLKTEDCQQGSAVSEFRLLEAVSSNGQKVVFEYSTRSDHAATKRLSKVLFKELVNGVYIDKYHAVLHQSYFGSTANNNLRLRLDKVEKVLPEQSSEIYAFEYNALDLPPVNSKSIDLWGYNNGAANLGLVPSLGNRAPNDYYIQASILTKMIYPTGGSSSFTYETNPLEWSGLRIKKLEDADANANVTKTKRYEYLKNNYVPISSVALLFERLESAYFYGHLPSGFVDYDLPVSSAQLIGCSIITEQTSPVVDDVESWLSNGLSYDVVTEYFEDATEPSNIGKNGKIEYRYNSHLVTNSRRILAFSPKLTEKTTYTKNGASFQPLAKEDYYYEVEADATQNFMPDHANYMLPPANIRERSVVIRKLEMIRDCITLTRGSSTIVAPKEFALYDSKFDVPAVYLKKSKATQYQAGVASQEEEKNYTYDVADGVLGPATTRVLDSWETELKEETKYSNSNVSALGYTTAQVNALAKAAEDNVIFPVWKKVWRNNSPIFENKITNDIIGGKSLHINEMVKPTGGVEQKNVQIVSYDMYRNPTEMLVDQTQKVSYRYNSRSELTAECKNASYQDFAFASFNDVIGAGFNYTSAGLNYADYYASSVSYQLPSILTVTGFDMGKTYILSGFVKNATVTVNGATVLAQQTGAELASGWCYFQMEVSPQSATIQIGGTGLVDELRFYPKQAELTTRAYGSLYGQVSAITAANGATQFFDYTGDGKLSAIKDERKHIVKSYKYHFVSTITAQTVYARIEQSGYQTNMYYTNPEDINDYTEEQTANVKIKFYLDENCTIPLSVNTAHEVQYARDYNYNLGGSWGGNTFYHTASAPAMSTEIDLGTLVLSSSHNYYDPWSMSFYSDSYSNTYAVVINALSDTYIPKPTKY